MMKTMFLLIAVLTKLTVAPRGDGQDGLGGNHEAMKDGYLGGKSSRGGKGQDQGERGKGEREKGKGKGGMDDLYRGPDVWHYHAPQVGGKGDDEDDAERHRGNRGTSGERDGGGERDVKRDVERDVERDVGRDDGRDASPSRNGGGESGDANQSKPSIDAWQGDSMGDFHYHSGSALDQEPQEPTGGKGGKGEKGKGKGKGNGGVRETSERLSKDEGTKGTGVKGGKGDDEKVKGGVRRDDDHDDGLDGVKRSRRRLN